jgi:hypothetical protein
MIGTQVLYKSASGANVATSGQTGDIDVTFMQRLFIAFVLNTLTGGTTPSVQFFIDFKDEFGNYIPMVAPAALTAPGQGGASVGPGLTAGSSVAQMPPMKCRIRWVVTGAPATATASISLYGTPIT